MNYKIKDLSETGAYYRKGDSLSLYESEIKEFHRIEFVDKFGDEMYVDIGDLDLSSLRKFQDKYVIERKYFKQVPKTAISPKDVTAKSEYVNANPSYKEKTVNKELVKEFIIAALQGGAGTNAHLLVKYCKDIAEEYESTI